MAALKKNLNFAICSPCPIVNCQLSISFCLLPIAFCLMLVNCLLPVSCFSQNNNVGIGTLSPKPSALLDVDASPANNKGVLVPRITALQRLAIPAPANSLLVFDTDSACFFYWNAINSAWKSLCNPGPIGPSGLRGNTGSSGIIGSTGALGITGSTGIIGSTGASGIIGAAGNTGSTGSGGITGSTGIIGSTGASGIIGAVGNTGSTGAVGITGSTGIIGSTGASGIIGSTGNTGSVGTTGSTGADLGTHWTITGNAGTTAGPNFIGTTDAADLALVTNNAENMRVTASGNVGIGTIAPNNSAKVDITSTSQGFVMPRLTSVQRKAIAGPIEGLQVYDTDLKGCYIYDGTKWDCVSVPAGSIGYFANITPPNGYLECNGQAVNRTFYAELFNAVSTLYGIGDGSTTFNLPDLRGEFVRGLDDGLGVDNDAARTIGSAQQGTVMWYDSDPIFTVSTINMTGGVTDAAARNFAGLDKTIESNWPNAYITWTGVPNSLPISTNGPAVHGGALGDFGVIGTSRPRNIALLPCIKY